MKITIQEPIVAVGIREVQQGDFFRYANGKSTDLVFVALEQKTENYNTYWITRNLNSDELRKIYVNTRKERMVVIVTPLELVVRDQNGSGISQLQEDEDAGELVQEKT